MHSENKHKSEFASSVQAISQARVMEWVAISFSRGSSQPRNQTRVSCFAGRFSAIWVTGEAQICFQYLPNDGIRDHSLCLFIFLDLSSSLFLSSVLGGRTWIQTSTVSPGGVEVGSQEEARTPRGQSTQIIQDPLPGIREPHAPSPSWRTLRSGPMDRSGGSL